MGGFAEKEIRVRETPLRQSPSQKSEISDSPLYTRGPLGAEEDGGVEVDGEVFALLRSDPSSVTAFAVPPSPQGEGLGRCRASAVVG